MSSARFHRYREWAVPATCVAAFVAVLLFAAASLTSVGLTSSRAPYYERYASALRAGHLWLEEKPDLKSCSWDLSFHEGRCYMYWGILPALIHVALPFVSDRVVSLAMATTCVFFLIRIFRRLAFPEPPAREPWALYLFLTFLTGLPATVLAARVYEEAILTGAAFGLAGLWYALPALTAPRDDDPALPRAWPGVAVLALAGLARAPWMAVSVLIFACLLWRRFKDRVPYSYAELARAAGAIAVVVAFQACLNVARFDDPREFGLNKQSAVVAYNATGRDTFAWSLVPDNVMSYFFTALPPAENVLSSKTQPYELLYPTITRRFIKGDYYRENGLALFAVMPSLALAFLAFRRDRATLKRALPFALATAPLALAIFMTAGLIYRYQLEANLFALFLLVPLAMRDAADESCWFSRLHWPSLALGTAIAGLNVLWVVRMLCTMWAYC